MLSRLARTTSLLHRSELFALARPSVDFSSKQKNKKGKKEKAPTRQRNEEKIHRGSQTVSGSSNQLRIPQHAALLLFASCIPQSYWFYKLLWSEFLSDAFIDYFQMSANWICTQMFLEGAALTSAVMIDYGVVKNDEEAKRGLRKKAVTILKYHPFLIGWSFTLIDVPSHNCLFPLILVIVHLLAKSGTMQNHNVLPMRYFYARTFVMIYNLVLLLVMWYMGRTARKEKLNLELEFFHRIQRMLLKYDQEFEGYKFEDGI